MHAPHTDWSRTSRKRLSLLKAGSDSKQCRITSFFKTITQLVRESPAITDILQKAQQQGRGSQFESVSSMLKALLVNAEKNAQRVCQGMRHQQIVKKFAMSLLIYCGPMAYNFLHRNVQAALPSLRSVQRIISHDYKPFCEGEFRFDDLVEHLKSYKAAKVVAVGEDATRLISRVEYDSESDCLACILLSLSGLRQ